MNLKNIKPDIRYLKEMENVVYDKEWFETADPDLELYYMYRGVEKKDGMRYDVTIIPARMLGKEFVKTKGHSHPCQETYTVLKGEVIFLLQKSDGNVVKDVYAIKAEKGDEITIPSNYDHIVINPSNQELKIGNWISKDCQNIYDLIEKMAGACYFYTKQGWVKNKNYKKIPKLRFKSGRGETGKRASFRS